MKTLKLIVFITLIGICSSFAQTPVTPATAPDKEAQGTKQMAPGMQMPGQQPMTKMNRYMVQIPHTKEECQKVMAEMREKGGPLAMRFDWGCSSGDHIGFAMLPGANEDAVRKMLPEGVQKMAKITKVDKMTPAQMEQMHK